MSDSKTYSKKEISGKQMALIIAPFVGAGGFAMSRFFLKSYYKKQKAQLAKLTHVLSKRISSFRTSGSSIEIENRDVYQSNENTASDKTKDGNA